MNIFVIREEKIKQHHNEKFDIFVRDEHHPTIKSLETSKISHTELQPNVPLIFHQIYKNCSLPAAYLPSFRSIIANHRLEGEVNKNTNLSDNLKKHLPGFKYMFWSDDNINNCVHKKLEDGDNMYNVLFKYDHSLEKADAIRYFILYEFGGLYLDLMSSSSVQ